MTHASHDHALLRCALDQKLTEHGANIQQADDYAVIIPTSITQTFARFMDSIRARSQRVLKQLNIAHMYQRQRAEKYGNRAFAIQLFVQKFHDDLCYNNYQNTIGIDELRTIAELTYTAPFCNQGDLGTAAAARLVCATLNLPHYGRRGVGERFATPRLILPKGKINVIPT